MWAKEEEMKKRIDVLLCNHFDLTWRRCFQKSLFWQGKTWIPYARIEEFYIERCLRMCEKDENFRFNIESAAVLRAYLEKHPEDEEKIRDLIAKKRLDLPFTGDNIVDSNLVEGESLIRNFLYGWRYLKSLGHDGGKMAYRRDAFGNSAQLPQILKGFGMEWVWGLSYTEPHAPVWQGLDGSRICCQEPPFFAESGSIDKYAPCPVCRGTGERDGLECPACEGRGIDWKSSRFEVDLPDAPKKVEEYSLWTQRSEELIPPWSMLDWPGRMREELEKRGETAEVRFATFSDLWEAGKERVRALVCDPDSRKLDSCELNANNTGVYVSRIGLKQRCRGCEARMFELEHLLVQAVEAGMEYPGKELENIWEKLLFLMFHDAVTGTVVDAAADELSETSHWILGEIERLQKEALTFLKRPDPEFCAVYNPGLVPWKGMLSVRMEEKHPCSFETAEGKAVPALSWKKENGIFSTSLLLPKIPPLSALLLKRVPIREDGLREVCEEIYAKERAGEKPRGDESAAEIGNERFRIQADGCGIVSIQDRKTGLMLKETDGIRVHEIYLEHDEGSPWTTLSADRRREKLSEKARLCRVEKNELYERLTFKIAPLNANTVEGTELSWSVTLEKGGDRIDFCLDVEYWDTYNRRIRVAFPAGWKGKALYEIPYGTLQRDSYPGGFDQWDNACGDWPALHWAGISGEKEGMAVINQGTPSYVVEHGEKGDAMLLSLLRSPCVPTYLHEPRSYDMRGYDGMRDTGRHQFRYALYLCGCSLEESDIVEEAESFHIHPVFMEGKMRTGARPELNSACAKLSAWYPDGKGKSVVRLFEYRGKGGEAILKIPGNLRAWRCDLKESELEEYPVMKDGGEERTGRILLHLRPFEILTIKLVREHEA